MNNKQIVKQIPLFIFAIILFAVTLIMLKVVNPFYVYLIIWFIVAPLVIYQWANIMKSIGNMMFNGRYKHTEQMPKITFLIATKHCPEFVQQSIDSVTNSCNKLNFTNYEVKVVTEVKDRFRKKENVKEVLVPASYVCTSKYKARALNYALSYLPNSKEEWIFHMDEDTRIIPQTIKSIMNFIKKEGDKHQIANGLSVFTENKNLLTFYAEAQRMWTYMWLMQQTKKTPVWMNGSNMLIRSDIEQSIGWDFNASINEDTIFVYYAHKKYGNIFGWHGGLTIELSAKNVKSLINQRKKWFYGSFTTILECPRNVRILRAYSSIA